jgi:AraC-like DNA-binding protein
MKRGRLSLFVMYFIPYLGFLIFLIVMTGVYYFSSQRLVQKETMENTLQNLKYSAYLGDLRLQELENVVTSLASDSRVRAFLDIEDITGSEYMKFINSWKDIPTYSITEEFLIDYVIYSSKTNAMISKYGAAASVDSFYNSLIEISDIDFSTWKSRYLQKYQTFSVHGSQKITINHSSLSGITLYQTIPMGFQNINKGTVILVVDPALFSASLHGNKDEGWYCISDSSGQKLVSHGSPQLLSLMESLDPSERSGYQLLAIDGTDWFIAYTTSEKFGWKYVMGIEKATVLRQVYRIRNFSIMLVAVVFILGIAAAVVLSRFNAGPIRKLLTVLPDDLSENDAPGVMQRIERSISQMKLSNSRMSDVLENQQPLITAHVFGKILTGGFTSGQELRESLEAINLSIPAGQYLACMIRLESGSAPNSSAMHEEKALVRSIVEDVAGSSHIIYDWDIRKLTILFSFDISQDQQTIRLYIETLLGGIKKVLATKHGIQVLCSGGSLYPDLSEVYRSASEADDVLNYATSLWGPAVCWFDAEQEDNEQYYYPLEMEQRLINLIRAGETEAAIDVINDIFKENCEKRILSVHMMLLLGNELFSTLMKAASRLSTSHDSGKIFTFSRHLKELHCWCDKIRSDKNLAPVQEMVIGLCRTISGFAAEQRQHPKQLLGDRFLAFLQEQQSNPNLSLTMMTDHFNLTEAYISHIFRELTGENFSIYLENMRIEKAVELLKDDHQIDAIVAMVGYQYKNTFYKAFKRVMQVSPGQYRDNLNLSQEPDPHHQ